MISSSKGWTPERSMVVSKWGNRLAVRLPKALVESLGLKAGDELSVVEAGEGVVAVSKGERRQAALDRMAARKWPLPAAYRFVRDEADAR